MSLEDMSETPPTVEPYPGWAQESRGRLAQGVSGAMTGLAVLFVGARVYSRMISLGRLALDDYILIVSILLSLLYVALTAVAISHGAGRHLVTLPMEEVHKAIYFNLISTVPGIMSFTLPKFAVLILLVKVLNPSRWHKAFMWVISVLYFLFSAVQITLSFAQCTPVAAQWGGAEGTCWDRRILFINGLTHGACSALFDFYLAAYPTFVICRLVLGWRKKLALSSSLGFGYCAAAVTAYKTYNLDGLLGVSDFTFAVEDIVLWTNVEADCVIIGACIPCLFPLVKKIWGASALASKPKDSDRKESGFSIITIGGSESKNKRRTRKPSSFIELDIIDENHVGKHIIDILEEPPFQASTSEPRDEEEVAAPREERQVAQRLQPSYHRGRDS